MKIRISNNKLVHYSFCNDSFHEWMLKNMQKDGHIISRPNANEDIWDISDNTFTAKVLTAIDELIDLTGANGIDWLNKQPDTIYNTLIKGRPKTITKISNPEQYIEYLIIFRGGDNLDELLKNPNVKIIATVHTYGNAKECAIKILKENNYGKRIYITYSYLHKNYTVWVRK